MNNTLRLNLSQYEGNDVTSYLVNYNDDMKKIDDFAIEQDNAQGKVEQDIARFETEHQQMRTVVSAAMKSASDALGATGTLDDRLTLYGVRMDAMDDELNLKANESDLVEVQQTIGGIKQDTTKATSDAAHAVQVADSLNQIIQDANTKAENAVATSEEAKSESDQAMSTANLAKTVSESAIDMANEAIDSAGEANTTATNALDTATLLTGDLDNTKRTVLENQEGITDLRDRVQNNTTQIENNRNSITEHNNYLTKNNKLINVQFNHKDLATCNVTVTNNNIEVSLKVNKSFVGFINIVTPTLSENNSPKICNIKFTDGSYYIIPTRMWININNIISINAIVLALQQDTLNTIITVEETINGSLRETGEGHNSTINVNPLIMTPYPDNSNL